MKTYLLEYRLVDEKENITPIYKYENINSFELLGRKFTHFFIKDGVIYERTSNTLEEGVHIIYVKKFDAEPFVDVKSYDKIGIEFREFVSEEVDSPFLTRVEVMTHEDVFYDFLSLDEIDILGDGTYWQHYDSELDEDRKTYVIYLRYPHQLKK